ncbi:MAG: DUF4153 domain-containing protein [Haliscomenobacteraceae bacterium CHB4]|nr:DUF4153 domain-containing protein [Haliscomenobacteraceae bacterium CHB4]
MMTQCPLMTLMTLTDFNDFNDGTMKLPSFGFLLQAFFQVIRRFPGTMLCAVVGVGALFALVEKGSEERILAPLWMVCQLGLPLLTGVVAFSESKGWEVQRSWLLQLLALGALAGYYFLLDTGAPSFEYVGIPRFLTLLVMAHLFVAVAPYLNARSVRDFWEYNRELFANIIIGVVFTLILYAGLALAILAVDQLFDLDLQERIYMRLFFLLAGIFNTAYFLFHFPKTYEFPAADSGYNVIFKNLCKYILIPIVGLYFLILYAYGGKIIATWNLPRGWVGSLVLGFSVAGIFTYLLNFYLPEHDDSAWVRGYRKWFWWVLLPLTVLLFVAIGRRIGEYGVTEPRFLVAHLGVWLFATCLYFLFSRRDNIKFIPISLFLFGLVFAFGPFNAIRVAERSQEGILQSLLEKNGRWKDGRLVQGNSAVPKEEVAQIISALDFLDQRDALRSMPWLPMPVDSFPDVHFAFSNGSRIAAWAGIKDAGMETASNFLNVNASDIYLRVDIQGYATFYPLELYAQSNEKPDSGHFFDISENQKYIEWKQVQDGKVSLVESYDLQPVLRKWMAKSGNAYLALSPGEATFDLPGRNGALRITVRNADVRKENEDLKLERLSGYLFLKKK